MNIEERSNWTNKEIEHLKNVNITEYDLASGGLSVIKEYKLLSQKYIDDLDKMEKEKKNIIIGKLQARLKNLSANMVRGFGKARRMFVDKNNIPDENILSIKKDALFLINCYNITGKVSDNLTFREKNTYSSYMRLNNKELYFSSLTKELEVKGISEECINMQKDFILKDIALFLGQAERLSDDMIYENLKRYRSQYLNRELPIETYRNLDTGLYSVNGFELSEVDEKLKKDIDISYNYIFYILPLIKILVK